MDNSDEIKRLRAKADELEKRQNKFNFLPEEIKLAENIHSKTCKANHTDGCGWYYEKWDGSTARGLTTRNRYLNKAKLILAVTKFEDAMNVIKNL